MIRKNIVNNFDKSRSVTLAVNEKVIFPSKCLICISADTDNVVFSFNGIDYNVSTTRFFMVSIVGNTYIGHRHGENIVGIFGTVKTREIVNKGPGILWVNIL